MDFLDPNKKRSNIIKLYVGYVLVAIAISMGALILLFAIFGYGFNSGQVVQNGLVFFSSQPENADVFIENTRTGFKDQAQTNTKFTLNEGPYKATITKDGYRSWQREFNLAGGAVRRMLYPFLFPDNLNAENKALYKTLPPLVSSSPDRQWIVVQQPGTFLKFDVYNANDQDAEKTITDLPASLLSKATSAQELSVVEWANDNQNILLKHTYDDKSEFIVFNWEEPAKSFNVNRLSNQEPYEVRLKDKKTEELYLQTDKNGLLETINVESKALTPLVANVLAYQSYGDDMLVYVEPNKTDTTKVSVKIKTNDNEYLLRTLPAGSTYDIDVARYNDNWYIVVASAKDNKVYIYKDPVNTLKKDSSNQAVFARVMRIDNPEDVSFSANTQFIAAQSGKKFAVYDAEEDVQYRYEIDENIDTSKPIEWMDGHRLITTLDGSVFIFDFDGINKQTLMPTAVADVPIIFDRDYRIAYNISKNEKQFALQQTPLIVEN